MQYVAVFATQYNSSLSSFVPNFRILSQAVAEKYLTKKCLYVFPVLAFNVVIITILSIYTCIS